jgi:hypothetical protein
MVDMVGDVLIRAIPSQKIEQCFVGSMYGPEGRDADLNIWLSENQPAGEEELMIVFDFNDLAPVKDIVSPHVMPVPAQIEDLIDRTEKGERTNLLIDGSPNHFFVKTERQDKGGIALLIVFKKKDGLWQVSLSTCGFTSAKLRSGRFFC